MAGDGTTGPTVLLIEDNLANIHLIERILAKRPEVTLLVATDGRRGVELATAHRPELVLLDRNLPDSSGEAILAQLRADDRTGAVPVVIVSADASPEDAARLRAAGASGYLVKPFDISELLELVDSHTRPAGPVTFPVDTVDRSIMEQLRGLDGLADLLAIFARTSAAAIEDLRRAVDQRDADLAAGVLHSLKGSAGSLGASDVAARAARLEVLLGRDGIGAIAASLDALAGAVTESLAALGAALLGEGT